ncbi:MAG: cytochrome c biogenesis protein [Flavobacteriales bacterium]|nr:cytochrome c biogenesis protein [Flavobacteriales bacterium]
MKKNWWKLLPVLLMVYAIPMSFAGEVSVQTILHETIRNLYFHVTMWFSMFILFIVSMVNAIMFLHTGNLIFDVRSEMYIRTSLLFGFIGIFTGMIWANFTWGAPWVNDPQLNGAAITILSYLAYLILRSSLNDVQKKARLAAVYNIFAFTLMFVLIGIMPRINDSLHPGKGGNPGFGSYDLAPAMRPVFYISILAWTLVGVWIAQIQIKIKSISQKIKSA